MTDFNFYGPFHFNDFTENGIFKKDAPNKYSINNESDNTLNIPDLNQPGIYIWGNLFDIDSKKKLLHPTDCTINNFKYNPKKHQFVPYYVGISNDNMFKERLLKHRNVRQGNAVGYIRFSFDYWKKFFKDADFHRESPFLIDIVRKNKNSIIYHNDKKVLRLIYPDMEITSIPSRMYKGEQKYDHPITAQIIDGVLLPDTLSEVVEAKKNFWFCFTPFSKAQYSNKDLKSLETFVFYCLKGKTTSRKDNCPPANRLINIIDNTNNSRIFKKIKFTDYTELIFPLNEFWGY